MASDDENLVSQVKVEGTEASAAALEQYADRGAAAFEKVDKAAKGAAAGVKGASKDIEAGANDASGALDQLGSKKIDTGNAAKLREVAKAGFDLGTELRKTIKDLSQFVTRVAALGAAGAAGAAGLLKLASGVAKSAQGASDALDKQTQAQTEANDRQLEATQATINYESAQRQLFRQFQQGAIDYATYSKNLRQLADDFREQRRVQNELQQAADATKEANDRLQKQLADRKAYEALIDTWGGPMLTSLLALGNQVNQLWTQFKNAFGPATAGLLDLILATLTKNSAAIGNFIDEGAKKIDAFVKENGPAIQQALTSIGEVAAKIFDGLIAAAPTLLAIFNNGIIPTIKAVGAALQVVSDLFKAFGIDVPAGAVAVVLALTTITGGVKVLIGVLGVARAAIVALTTAFGPWGLVIAAVVLALGLLATQVDWAAFSQKAIAAGQAILDWFKAFPDNLAIVWDAIKQKASDTWNAIVQFVKDTFNGILQWFQAFPGNLQIVWDAIKQGLIDAFNSAVSAVKSYLSDLASSAMSYLQPIIDALKAIISLSGEANSAGSGGSQSFAGGGHVRGAGTSTSDSIAAWLSNNEFVMKAKAVRKYGVAFMRAINSGQLDLGDAMQRFANGGLVQAFSAPRVSMAPVTIPSGGSTAATRILNLTIGSERFEGLMAPEQVADRMERFAVGRYARSAGRKPSWVGGSR